MLHKLLIAFFIPLFLFIGSPAEASVIDWQNEKVEIEEQRQEIKSKMVAAKDKEKIKLGMKDNKLAAYQVAYEKAIELTQPEATTTNFKAASLLPGQKVPAEYIPIYKAAGERYNVDWYVLAAIHRVETNFSRSKSMVSTVGAIGHTQFMPKTWIGWSYPGGTRLGNANIPTHILTDPKMIKRYGGYGVDGNGDGKADPWDLQDAIHSTANYLSASGYSRNIRKAILSYNHADWYVIKVMEIAASIKNN